MHHHATIKCIIDCYTSFFHVFTLQEKPKQVSNSHKSLLMFPLFKAIKFWGGGFKKGCVGLQKTIPFLQGGGGGGGV